MLTLFLVPDNNFEVTAKTQTQLVKDYGKDHDEVVTSDRWILLIPLKSVLNW